MQLKAGSRRYAKRIIGGNNVQNEVNGHIESFIGGYKIWCTSKSRHIACVECVSIQLSDSDSCFWCGYYVSDLSCNSMMLKQHTSYET